MISTSGSPPHARVPVRTLKLAVTNPASHARLEVVAHVPSGEGAYPLVVLVPGGLSAGETYFGGPGIARRLAGLGYAVVYFDADGRGRSAGEEAYNGAIHQAGLAAVIASAAGMPQVDRQGAVVAAFCFGATMAMGALARHPGLPVRLLLDWEGPANRTDVLAGREVLGWKLPPECETDSWWNGREAVNLIDGVETPYLRVEGHPNHLRIGPDGCLALIDRAANRPQVGGVDAWSRVNGNRANRRWTGADQPRWLPRLPAETAILSYLVELAPPAPDLPARMISIG